MRWLRGETAGCDSLDIAAVWPVCGSVATMPLPDLRPPRRTAEQDTSEKNKETL
jgi:hypothetical protein